MLIYCAILQHSSMLAKFVIYEAGLYGLWSAWSMEGWGGGGDVWRGVGGMYGKNAIF